MISLTKTTRQVVLAHVRAMQASDARVGQSILAGTREVSFQLEAMASRLAHLALLDALLIATAAHHRERTEAALGAYSDMLGRHRL